MKAAMKKRRQQNETEEIPQRRDNGYNLSAEDANPYI